MLRLILLTILLYSISFSKENHSVEVYIPVNAYKYMGKVYEESDRIITGFRYPYYFSSLIEQESCVVLYGTGYYARRCWSPVSELKTKREQGVGFGQITRTWKRDGTIRFDTLNDLRKRYPKELSELTWDNIKERPDLQIRAMLLLWKGNFYRLTKDITYINRIAFSDAAYNMGMRGVTKRREECKLRRNCNPKVWFNNVATICRRKKIMYGRRTCDIPNEHVKNTLTIRLNKYEEYYKKYFNNDYIYNVYDDGNRTRFLGE